MTKVLFYCLLKPLSYLPYQILYGISDVLYISMYYVFSYRKKIVLQNLHNSFPEKDKTSINLICKQFYQHLCDLIIESIKLFSIEQKQIKHRFKVLNPTFLQPYFDANKSVLLVGGHYNNWEMLAAGINEQVPHDAVALYSKLSNAFFDQKMKSSRSAFGLRMVTTKESFDYFKEHYKTPRMTIFGADQSPTYSKSVHWTTFLSQKTAVALGTERFAKKYNLPVVYGTIAKLSRGHYSLTFHKLCDNPADTKDGEITEMHTRLLEQQIVAEPQYWLWTHKRWKRKQ